MDIDPAIYDAKTRKNLFNALWERPAVTELNPEPLVGKRVLDLGCATGFFTELLVERGADVVAIDKNPKMTKYCQDRLNSWKEKGKLEVRTLDLRKLDYGDNSFDGIVASLVLHHLPDPDFGDQFKIFRRILSPKGVVVISTMHPFWLMAARFNPTSYYVTEPVLARWKWTGLNEGIVYYRRSLTSILNPIRDAGFSVKQLIEPAPNEKWETEVLDTKEKAVLRQDYDKYATSPAFLILELEVAKYA